MKNRLSGKTGFVGLILLLLPIPFSVSLAPAASPITPSGLNTQVTLSATPPPGKTQFDITGGTRPGGGPNLFHSFGQFNVPNNNIANFLNDSGLATSNILGRVNGGNISNIFGTIQTTGFGNANLFLMNPAGFLFGPNATVNAGGMVSFTTADYLRLADGVRFNAAPHAAADALLSVAPVAAFGFLGSNPGAITVQGSQLTVAQGTGISLVGGNITMQSGTLDNGTVQAAQLSAPSGQINVVSVGKPSHPHVGGEVTNGAGFVATGFKSLGAITVSNGSTIDTSGIVGSGHAAGSVSIRGGQFVMDDSSITAVPGGPAGLSQINGNVEVTADQVALSNHSTIDTSTPRGPPTSFTGSPGNITFNVNTFSSTDSTISARVTDNTVPSGAVTIQGLQGAGTSAHAVSLTNTVVDTSSLFGNLGVAGPIVIRADNIALNQSSLSAIALVDGGGGVITLDSKGRIESQNSRISTTANFGSGGTIDLKAGTGIDLANTTIDAHSSFFTNGGAIITMAAPVISIRGSELRVWSGGSGPGGTINLTATKAVSLTNGTVLSADNFFGFSPFGSANGGTILINGGHLFTSQQSTISAGSTGTGNGGTIQVQAHKVEMTDTQLTTSVTGGPQSVGGTITIDANKATFNNSQVLSTATEGHAGTIGIDANKATFNNSQVLSTATEGHGGTIGITTPKLNSINSVIDATSQTGTNGTVIISP